ncbi:ATPase [Paenibacillus sp. H1-7]|uniref:N-acetylglucosamine kinase n=1 Tax=Paenibacillus sp. H1-7 TaxID=2282849 RepID=UPI001EF783E1|nr:BadF/BadG/BcrA/BcrD ATPase family protein [Paenibacillus sp. H1-7]ULL17515.1 ATPase [Paenibacillus sp. H1-7]
MAYYLGVDAGGSKTYAVITDETGRLIAAGKGGNGNHQIDASAAQRNIEHAVMQALRKAGLKREDIAFAWFGMAGADREADFLVLRPMIAQLGFPRTEIVCDTIIALRAGTNKPYGVVSICGTGTNCAGISPDGDMWQCGGFGYHYGDYGGGSWLALEAFRAAVRGWEGRGEPTLLTEAVPGALDYHSIEHMFHSYLDSDQRPPLDVVKTLFEMASQGDLVSLELLRRQGAELGMAARAVVNRLGLQDTAFDLVLAGSVLTRGDGRYVHPYILEEARKAAPHCSLAVLTVEPVVGAVLLAMEKDGLQVTEQMSTKLAELSSLEGVAADE